VSGRVVRAPGLAVGAAALFVAMVSYGGYLFTMALHLQGGLGESAARAGLVFAPAAIGFAITGLLWRRLPPRVHAPMVPAGLFVTAFGYLLLAPILRGGASGGVALEADLLVVGLALGLAFSPMITLALAHVPLADAADASGVLVTVFQLGQLVGVAALGSAYLSLIHATGAAASAHALGVTQVALACSALLAAGFATAAVRPRRAVLS
jgi:hypothetical protein